jgi:hypothetical protein
MAIDSTKKSSRLLQSRRYTLDTLTDGQEAFTQVLDLGSSEIYSQTNLIPTSSLPFSGSSQSGATSGVLKFWYRQKLTRGVESDGRQVWFFLNPSAASADSQTIQTTQVTNFISPKYSIPSLAASNTELSTPGYLTTVRTSTDGITFSDPINTNNYAFDYKSGVLQFATAGVTPGSGDVYISVNQYIGRTLASDTTSGYSGSFSGSFQGDGNGLINIPAGSIVGLNLTQIATATVSASVSSTGNSFTVSSASVNLLTIDSGSRVTATTFSGSLIGASNTTGSLTGSFSGIGSGSFSGSFQGNGGGLTNVPASSIVGLNLSQIATGSVTGSTSPDGTVFRITSASIDLLTLDNLGNLVVSGSEIIGNHVTAKGNATITGSLTVNGTTLLNNNLSVANIFTVGNSSSLQNTTVTGSLLVTQNFTVLGTASFTRVTGSEIIIGASTITLNTDDPIVRFGGIIVQDSGSFGANSTSSFLYDGEKNQWLFQHEGAGEQTGSSIAIFGPLNEGTLGTEQGLTEYAIPRAYTDHGHHIGNSNIYSTGSYVTINKAGTGSKIAEVDILGSVIITGSNLLSSPDGTVSNKYALIASQSAWHYSDNVGYPVGTNQWGTGLNGSYFNLFTPNTDTATILRFVAGLLSSSAPAPTPNTKTYGSLTNSNNLSGTGTISGYVPQDISGSDLLYLNSKGFANTGSTIFSGVGTVYTTLNPTYTFSSVFGGATTVSSSADPQLFGLGATGLTFNVSGGLNWRFDDNFIQTSTATSSSQALLSSPTSGLTVAEIPTANPAVIPNAFQDGKFANIFSSTFFNGGRSITSVSASGYYHISASVGYSTGSSQYTTFNTNFNKVFAAPISSIVIPTQTISFTQSVTPLTATSRSLSGAPYLQGATWTYSITSSGVFEPLYYGNSTIFSISDDNALVAIGGTTSQVMSAGTISGTSLVFSTSSVQRTTGTIPFRTDRLQSTNTSTFSTTTGSTNIGQTSTLSSTTYNITSTSFNRSGGTSTITSSVLFHSASTFGQPLASGSMGYYGSAQGYDGGSLTGASETFSGETFRLKVDNTLLSGSYQNGTKFTTSSYDPYNLGALDLQVKPGYLVKPGGSYGYWLTDPNASKAYKFYARAFRVTSAYGALYIDLGKTLNNWTATGSDGVSAAVIFNSVFGSGNLPGTFGNSNPVLFDISATLSSGIEINNQVTNDSTNPFAANINVFGNPGGTISGTKYGVVLDSGGAKQILNPSATPTAYVDFIVLVRYKGDIAPVTTITQTNS